MGIPTGTPKHGFVHEIETMGGPICSFCSRLDPAKLAVAKEYFKDIEAAGICKRSNSPWASPFHMAVKPDGSYRPCGDFCQLNATVPSTYSIPNIKDFSAGLAGCTFSPH